MVNGHDQMGVQRNPHLSHSDRGCGMTSAAVAFQYHINKHTLMQSRERVRCLNTHNAGRISDSCQLLYYNTGKLLQMTICVCIFDVAA